MSDLSVGKRGTFHSEHGDVPCWVIEYSAGKDEGDHRIGGFTNSKMKAAGAGDVFNVWTVVGTEVGAFTLK